MPAFLECARSYASVGEQVQEGQLVAELRDVFGETVEALHAPATGAVLFLVTSLAVREGDPLLAIGAT